MSAADLLRFAARALTGHRLRSALSLLGVAIGVAAVVVLTALGEGAQRYVTGQFAGLGTNLLIVLPGRTETTGAVPGVGGVPNDLTLDDARALARSVPGVEKVAPVSMGTETVSHRARQRQVAVLGSTSELLEVRRLKLARGEFLPPGELDRGDAVVVLASKAARELFPGEDPLAIQALRLELDAALLTERKVGDEARAIQLLERCASRAGSSPLVERRALDELVRLHERSSQWHEAARALASARPPRPGDMSRER